MNRRAFYFDKWSTWHDWRCTLTAKDLTPPEPKLNLVEIDGAHGALDLTEALTGEPVYDTRTASASFMCSEGTHRERETLLRRITTTIHGRRLPIIDPDDPEHFLLGRVTIKEAINSVAYLSFKTEAICDPWRYALEETTRAVPVSGSVAVVLTNDGDKTLCPTVTTTGTLDLTFNGKTVRKTAGVYKFTDLRLPHGSTVVGVSGRGSVTFTYREAVL